MQNRRRWRPPVRHVATILPFASGWSAGPLAEMLRPASEKQYALSRSSPASHDASALTASTIRYAEPAASCGESPQPVRIAAASNIADSGMVDRPLHIILTDDPALIFQPFDRPWWRAFYSSIGTRRFQSRIAIAGSTSSHCITLQREQEMRATFHTYRFPGGLTLREITASPPQKGQGFNIGSSMSHPCRVDLPIVAGNPWKSTVVVCNMARHEDSGLATLSRA